MPGAGTKDGDPATTKHGRTPHLDLSPANGVVGIVLSVVLGITVLRPWLVLFVSLLGSTPGSRPRGSGIAFFVLSAAAALLGAIATKARVREAGEAVPVREAARLWRLGVLAAVPAWALVLVGQVVR